MSAAVWVSHIPRGDAVIETLEQLRVAMADPSRAEEVERWFHTIPLHPCAVLHELLAETERW